MLLLLMFPRFMYLLYAKAVVVFVVVIADNSDEGSNTGSVNCEESEIKIRALKRK